MREYHFARHLARSHRLTLGFVADTSDVAGTVSALRSEFGDLEFATVPRAWKSLASAVRLAAGESCTLSYFRSEALRTRLADRMRRTSYDLVFVLSSSMIQYALEAAPAIPLVVDFGTLDSEWWVRQAARGTFGATRFFRTEAIRLRTAEAAAARRAVRCVVESQETASIVASLAPGAVANVIPSGVDVDETGSVLRVGKAPTVVLCIGTKDDGEIDAAVKFCETIDAAVRTRVPGVRFVVAGVGAPGSAGAAKNRSGVEMIALGTDRRLVFHDCAVAVAPLRPGADLRSGVLEPMAAGVPVVAGSSVGRHLAVRIGWDVKVADSSAEFAAAIVELLLDGSLRREVGGLGQRFIESNFSWDQSARRLEEMVRGLAGIFEGRSGENGACSPRAVLGS
jgi:glycosyltransferase involved in cell wall biosynthesis